MCSLRKSQENQEAEIPKLSVFIGQKLVFRRNYIQHVKDGIQIQVYNINNESVNHFSQFISEKLRKIFKNLRLNFGKSLRKLRLR